VGFLWIYGSSQTGTGFAFVAHYTAQVKGGLRKTMEGQSTTIASKILQFVRAHPGCGLDDLVERLSDVQWSDVFVEVDRLSRSGELCITKPNAGFLFLLHAVS
jgi:hypothetical protein